MATQIQSAKIVTEEIENEAGANPYSISLGTENTTTGGSTLDFTSIPSGVKVVRFILQAVSTSGSSDIIVQIGDAGGIETSGYLGSSWSANTTNQNYTDGFGIHANQASGNVYHSTVTLCLVDSSNNTWVSNGVTGRSDSGGAGVFAGTKSLTGVLDRVRLTTQGGSDTIDANGGINIQFQQENNMADVIEIDVQTGEETTRSYTQEEKDNIATAQAEAKKNFDALDYKAKRMSEYPTIEECVHAILDDDLEALQVKRTAVKEKYPK